MKAIKLILSVLFLFPTAKGFCQNPIIQNTNICTTTGSMASFTVDYLSSSNYMWEVKISEVWTPITSSNASSVYSDYNSSTLNITKSAILPVATGTWGLDSVDTAGAVTVGGGVSAGTTVAAPAA